MPGCRPLTDSEIDLVLSKLENDRDRCLFILGIRTGLRISELTGTKIGDDGTPQYVGLRVRDVWKLNRVVDSIWIRKSNVKGGTVSRDIPLHQQARTFLEAHIRTLPSRRGEAPLFQTEVGVAMTRFIAHHALKKAFHRADLTGRLATHSCRKTFAENVYKALGHDLLATTEALGHTDVRNTQRYLTVNKSKIDKAILEG